MQRFLIISQKRKDFDLNYVIGNLELSIALPSLFSPDGSTLLCSDKSKITLALEKLCELNCVKIMIMDKEKF